MCYSDYDAKKIITAQRKNPAREAEQLDKRDEKISWEPRHLAWVPKTDRLSLPEPNQAGTLFYQQDAFWVCGITLSAEARFSEGSQNSSASLEENKECDGEKGKRRLLGSSPHPLMRPWTRHTHTAHQHNHNPARLQGQCPAQRGKQAGH